MGYSKEFRTHKKIDPERLKKYVRDHPDALQKDIANYFGCGISSVSEALNLYKVPYIIKRPNQMDLEEIKKYIHSHPSSSLNDIATHFKVKPQSINFLFRRNGLSFLRDFKHKDVSSDNLQEYLHNQPDATLEQISSQFNCSPTLIAKKIKEYGITRNIASSKYNETLRLRAVRFLEAGHPYSKATKKFGVPGSTLALWVAVHKKEGRLKNKNLPRQKIEVEKLKGYIRAHPDALQKDIAAHFGYDTNAVSRTIAENNIPYIKKRPTPSLEIDVKELKKYIRKHPDASLRKLAVKFNCSPAFMSNKSKQYGITRAYDKKKRA